MKIIITYKSKYGSGRQYALWLSEALHCKAEDIDRINLKELQSCDVIIHVGGIYASRINGFKMIKKNLPVLKNKKLLLCMVGMTNPNENERYQEYFKNNVPEQYQGIVQPFALRGDQLFSKMGPISRLMMKVPKSVAEKKPAAERNEDDKRFIDNFGKDIHFVEKESISDVVAYVHSLSSNQG